MVKLKNIIYEIWSAEQQQHFVDYYAKYNGFLKDKVESDGYTLSLWHYPNGNFYEINVNYKDFDFTDPNVQNQNVEIGSGRPIKLFMNKIKEWYNVYGHLAMGSTNDKKLNNYKKFLKRVLPDSKIYDVTETVPAPGKYFFVVGLDTTVMDRLNKVLTNT